MAATHQILAGLALITPESLSTCRSSTRSRLALIVRSQVWGRGVDGETFLQPWTLMASVLLEVGFLMLELEVSSSEVWELLSEYASLPITKTLLGGFFHFSGEYGLAADNVQNFEVMQYQMIGCRTS